MEDQESGTLYVLANPFMPDLVKIGYTTNVSVESRIRLLSSATGVPVGFSCYFAAEVESVRAKEKTLHSLFADVRVNPKREFFKLDPEKVVLAIQMGDYKDVTPAKTVLEDPDEEAAHEKAEKEEVTRRNRINLSAIGILPGTELTLSRDENVHATVVDDRRVQYDGNTTSLSDAALNALHKLGYKTPAASGSNYWTYEGRTLHEIRVAKEAEAAEEPQ
jgi:hypothetical protein